MGRLLRIEYEGALHHVTTRGNYQQEIFRDDSDRESFLQILSGVVERNEWICHGYCLMGNHYHLLIETPRANLSSGMAVLNSRYASRINWQSEKSGHMFQRRYHNSIVEKRLYGTEVLRYIVLNPVRAGMVATPEEWLWSSYRATVGLDQCPTLLSTDWSLSLFGKNTEEAQNSFVQYVYSDIENKDAIREHTLPVFMGSASFAEEVLSKSMKNIEDEQHIKRLKKALRPSLAEIIKRPALSKELRDEQILQASKIYLYSIEQIARYLDINQSTIKRIVSR